MTNTLLLGGCSRPRPSPTPKTQSSPGDHFPSRHRAAHGRGEHGAECGRVGAGKEEAARDGRRERRARGGVSGGEVGLGRGRWAGRGRAGLGRDLRARGAGGRARRARRAPSSPDDPAPPSRHHPPATTPLSSHRATALARRRRGGLHPARRAAARAAAAQAAARGAGRAVGPVRGRTHGGRREGAGGAGGRRRAAVAAAGSAARRARATLPTHPRPPPGARPLRRHPSPAALSPHVWWRLLRRRRPLWRLWRRARRGRPPPRRQHALLQAAGRRPGRVRRRDQKGAPPRCAQAPPG